MKKLIFLLLIVHSTLLIDNCMCQSGWFQQQSGVTNNLNDVFFINELTGWVTTATSKLLMTTNGGINWNMQQIYSNPFPNLYTINFANNSTGYIGAGYSEPGFCIKYLFKTTNQGSNWFVVNSDFGGYDFYCFSAIAVITPDIIFAASSAQYSLGGSEGDVRKSTNGGANFMTGYGNGSHPSVTFINELTGWTVSNYNDDVGQHRSSILKTTNSGLNWTIQFKDSVSILAFSKVIFLNENTGYALARSNNTQTKFFKTTNGGINWFTTLLATPKHNSIQFKNINTGWICGISQTGDTSSIAMTTNGGQTWTNQRTGLGLYTHINSIYFINTLTGYAVGGSGTIIKTTTSGITFAKQISQTIPDKFELNQNYPNPFNPVTKIKFSVPLWRGEGGRIVTLKIFDILGREIQTLVNEKLNPGTYEVTFDGSNFASGVYFYTLKVADPTGRTGEYLETRKMILLK